MALSSRKKLLALDDLLRDGQWHGAKEIAARLGVSERTVIRHIQALREEGAPVEDGKKGYRYADRSFSLRPARVAAKDLIGLALALAVLQQYRKNELVRELERRIREAIDRFGLGDEIEKLGLSRYLSFHVSGPPGRELGILDRLLDWAMTKTQIRLRYRSKGQKAAEERLVDPYGLSNRDGVWYLVAFDHKRRRFIPFSVARIESAAAGEPFEPDPEFDLQGFFRSTFFVMKGERPEPVRIRFSGEAADLVRAREYHPSQKIAERPDGSIDFEVTVETPEELLWFALDFGDKAEILEPAWLREKMAGIVERMGTIYARGKRGV